MLVTVRRSLVRSRLPVTPQRCLTSAAHRPQTRRSTHNSVHCCRHPNRCHPRLFASASANSDAASDANESIENSEFTIPAIEVPPLRRPAPLSIVGYGGALRPTQSSDTVSEALQPYAAADGNLFELVRGVEGVLASAIRIQRAKGLHPFVILPVSYGDIEQFILEQRRDRAEQRQIDRMMEERKVKRAKARAASALSLTDANSQPIAASEQPLAPITSADEPVNGNDAPPSTDSVDFDILPINDVGLFDNNEPFTFDTIELFPYLHAYVKTMTQLHDLGRIDLCLLDGLDKVSNNRLKPVIEQWFVALEQLVLSGQCRWFGIDSERFLAANTKERLSVSWCIDTALSIIDRPHFIAIRFPFTLFDTRALRKSRRRPLGQCFADRAQSKGIWTIGKFSTDARDRMGIMKRIESMKAIDGKALASQLQSSLNTCVALERKYDELLNNANIVQSLSAADEKLPDRMELKWCHLILAQRHNFDSLIEFEWMLHTVIRPRMHSATRSLAVSSVNELADWAREYRFQIQILFLYLLHRYQHEQHAENEMYSSRLDSLCPALKVYESVEAKTLALTLASQIGTVMVTAPKMAVETLRHGSPNIPRAEAIRVLEEFQSLAFQPSRRAVHKERQRTRKGHLWKKKKKKETTAVANAAQVER